MVKSLVLNKAFDLEVVEAEKPTPKQDEVCIRVKAVSICGSDLTGYRGINSLRVTPLVMGHEFSGEIESCGLAVSGLKPGMRVTVNPSWFCGKCDNCKQGHFNLCDSKVVPGTSVGGVNTAGAMAEYLCVPASSVIPLTDNISFEEASILEPFAVSLHGVNRAGDIKNKRTAVIGCGPIGLLAMQCIRSCEAKQLVAMDIVPQRLDVARKCGATDTLNLLEDKLESVWDLTGGMGVDIVYDCVGNERSVEQATQIVKNGGMIVIIGMAAQEIKFPIKRVVAHEFTIVGSYQYVGEMEDGIRLLQENKLDFSDIITSVMKLEDGKAAFDALTSKNPKDVKIVLCP